MECAVDTGSSRAIHVCHNYRCHVLLTQKQSIPLTAPNYQHSNKSLSASVPCCAQTEVKNELSMSVRHTAASQVHALIVMHATILLPKMCNALNDATT